MSRRIIFLAGIMCLVFLGGVVSAVNVTVSPDVIQQNDTITISVEDLTDGSEFSLLINSSIALHNRTDFLFKAKNLTMPFALQNPMITVDTQPIEPDSEVYVKAKTGSTIKSIGTVASGTTVHIEQPLDNIGVGRIDSLEVTGTSPTGAGTVLVALELTGKKSGVNSSAILLSLFGVTNGSARMVVCVDGEEVMAKTIWIGAPVTYPKGDVNHNQRVDIGDAASIAYMVINREPPVVSEADFNGNGMVDIGDAAKIAYYLVGKVTAL